MISNRPSTALSARHGVRRVTQRGIKLIEAFEGLELEAYQDIVGIWTIGYGWTGPIHGQPSVGLAVEANEGKPFAITRAKAEALLIDSVQHYARAVDAAIAPGVELSNNQFDALVSLTYNIGVGAMRSSTFMRRLNNGDFEGCAEAMLWWNKAGGEVVAGLKRRRQAEATLFMAPDSQKIELCEVDYAAMDIPHGDEWISEAA